MAQKLYEEDNIQAIANAIRSKNGATRTYRTNEMASAIEAIQTASSSGGGIPESALTITGNCQYRFAKGGWDWFLDMYKDRLSTTSIDNAISMFDSSDVKEIPFDINLTEGSNVPIDNTFYGTEIETVPYVNGKISSCSSILSGAKNLKNIPEDWADKIDWSYLHTNTSASAYGAFQSCSSLEHIPASLMKNLWNKSSTSTGCCHGLQFNMCCALQEIIGIMACQATLTSNRLSSMFGNVNMAKNITFALNEDGTPQVVEWKSQTIDLMSGVGYVTTSSGFLANNISINTSAEVTSPATYQALKDTDDWWTQDTSYSRYNHDSAVATINSLPDTSAYLASKGGTNTIKFKGVAGSSTDGGAISTLTEEEIAVATARGWTVSLV